jgi:hypothetical protein
MTAYKGIPRKPMRMQLRGEKRKLKTVRINRGMAL